jgi:hypothetical protein
LGDFLRALVTADLELNPDDPYDLRFNMIEGFRARGIYPEGVLSLAEESLVWPSWSDLALQCRKRLLDALAQLFRRWRTPL